MPSPRRMRLLMMAAIGTIIFLVFYKSGLNSEGAGVQGFYQKTVNAMDGKGSKLGQSVFDSGTGTKAGQIPADKDGDGDIDADDDEVTMRMQERLKAAEQKAKENANEKAPRPDSPHKVVGVGSSAEGQVKKLEPGGEAEANVPQQETVDPKLQEAEDALAVFISKSPVLIFSKTYCPYSKRAKGVLLEKYLITPAPLVVELDEHPLGPYLQDVLQVRTGRRSVPNIMVHGKSIGGSDEIVKLDTEDTLAKKIIELGDGSVDMTERFVPVGAHD